MFSRTAPTFLALCLCVSACAPGFSTGDVSPSEIPALEATVEAEPTDAAAWTRLGVAYGVAERPDDALRALERAVALPDAPTAAWAHLGTWREETGDVAGAVEAYRRYLAEGGGNAEEAVESRLAVVERELMAQRAREALAMEEALTDVPPDPATVGVMPLTVDGPEEYQALGVGLAGLLTTDLSLTDRIEVIERAQLNALIEEMELALGGFTDAEAVARTGRLMRAGRLVQGDLVITEQDGQARVSALILDATEVLHTGQAEEAGPLDLLMDLEEQLALEIYRELGVELTSAERARLAERPTRNLQAFLAYSEGLQLLDQGAYEAAAGRFDAATSLDPGFDVARQAAQRMQAAATSSAQGVSQAARGELAPTGAGAYASRGSNDALDQLVNSTLPGGVSTTETGGGSGSNGGQGATVETTETTAGTGVGETLTVPIVLVRPRPHMVFWRIW